MKLILVIQVIADIAIYLLLIDTSVPHSSVC